MNMLQKLQTRPIKSFVVRVPRPTRTERIDDRELVQAFIDSLEIRENIVQTSWRDGTEMGDSKTEFDGGWRVGTIFVAQANSSSGHHRVTYAIRVPRASSTLRVLSTRSA